MAADEKWYFTKEQLANTPSTKCGYDVDRELSCRQQAAHLIQDMGQRLQVSQLCINTAIVYMHRFYVFHSFSQFHLDAMAAAALFLAAKVEEMPRKLEHVIRVKQICQHRDQPALDVKSEQYLEQSQDLVFNENVLLQTLGFDVAIDHPHTHVVRCCHLVRASKDLAQTSYFMASNSLHLTTMCLQYKPTVVACFCIHLACKWSNWEIPQSNEGKYWFYYVDKTVTQDLLEQLTEEFLVIFEKCPSRLKKKIKSANQNSSSYQFDTRQRDSMHEGVSFQSHHRPQDPSKPSSSQIQPSSSQRDSREYQEKRERDRLMASQGAHSQHRDGHHRSHHTGHPHPSSSSSALLKPHSGMPVHGKVPHPGQHRSSTSHHPRPDHHNRPEYAQRADHPSRPEHQQRGDHQPRQDRQTRPEHGGVRPDHHPRSEHQLRPDQVRPDHHQSRPDHQQRVDHQIRPDHQQRSDRHGVPDHQNRLDLQGRTDHTLRSDHPGNLARSSDHQLRLDPSARPEVTNRQDHSNRLEHQVGPERHERLDGAERHSHPEPRYSGVTASRDQLRREAALQREASRRDIMHNLPSNIMMNSPAQRTTSGDSAISSSSSISLTPSSQDSSSIGTSSVAFAGSSSLGLKHQGSSEQVHRHSVGYDKSKSSGPTLESHSRHRSSLPVADRRPINTSVLDRKMMQEISERRQLESFFGKTEAQERMNEKHLVKHSTSVAYKDVKKETEAVQQPPQAALVPSVMHIKKEKVSPSRQSVGQAPSGRVEIDASLSSGSLRSSFAKPLSNEYSVAKVFKSEPDPDPLSETRNGTTVPSLITPKVEKVQPDVQSSIFSPEKTWPKERELSLTQRAVKSVSSPSPGIAFGLSPVSSGKLQSTNSRNKPGSISNDGEISVDSLKIERDAYDGIPRDNRGELKNPHVNEISSMAMSNRILDSRLAPITPKVEPKHPHQLLNKTLSYPIDHKALYPPASVNPVLTGRSSGSIVDDRQTTVTTEANLNQAPVLQDARSIVQVKTTDVRTTLPIVPIEGDLGAVAFPASESKELAPAPPSDEGSQADHHHHKSKKKKEKKEKHKHKDKDKEKHRDEKKHKSKHKEKDKERRKADTALPEVIQTPSERLTLKIPKKNITPPPGPVVAGAGGGLKLKINLAQLSSASSSSSSKESRKRERDRSSPSQDDFHPKAPRLSAVVETSKRGVGNSGHSSSSKSSYDRQNGLESRGGGRHIQHPQHYSGSKVRKWRGMHGRPFQYEPPDVDHSSMSFNHNVSSPCVPVTFPDTRVPPPPLMQPIMYYPQFHPPYSYYQTPYVQTSVFASSTAPPPPPPPPPPPLPKGPPPTAPPPPPPV